MPLSIQITPEADEDYSAEYIANLLQLIKQMQTKGHAVAMAEPVVVKADPPPSPPTPQRGRPRKAPVNGAPTPAPADVQADAQAEEDEDLGLGIAAGGLDPLEAYEQGMDLARRLIVLKGQAGRDALKEVTRHFGEPMFSKIPKERGVELYKLMVTIGERLGVQP
jgi:hypothetical protein